MVKKCLIAIAVVALLVTTVQAGSPSLKKEGTWPWTKIYDSVNICTFNVKLEVGHYVQLKNCTGDHKREMKLEQVECSSIGKSNSGDFPCYEDCVDLEVRANFPATFGASFDRHAGDVTIIGGDKYSLWWDADRDTIVGDGSWEDLKLCMKAWDVELWNSEQISGWAKVGTITISVKPQSERWDD